ncbi:MAG: carboxypeptidase-like regulatory domain-containing protein [Bacteroidales bacterium]
MQRKPIFALLIFFLILIIASAGLYAQNADSSYYFYGKVLSLEKQYPVAFAHVINVSTSRGVVSDSSGNFETWVNPADTLNISAIGFEHTEYIAPKTNPEKVIEIILVNKSYDIPEVSISYLGTYKEFKYKVINLELEDEHKLNPQTKKLFKHVKLEYPLVDEPKVTSPASLIYSVFSKEAKGIKKYLEVKRKDEARSEINDKYNIHVIQNLTGLKGPEAKEFMDFCNFKDEYILSISEYNLYSEILLRYEAFLEEKEKTDTIQ